MFNKDTYANFQMAIMYLRIMKDLLNRRRNRKSLEFAALSAGRYLNQLDMIMKGDKLYEIAKREVI